ncbi:MAG: endolytic transglycosylase MltG, partial [Eubacteriales bacterium]
MDNHFNNDETRRVPLPGSESPVPEQFTPEHFDDDREPEQPQKQPKRRRSRRQMNAGCAGSMVYMIAVVGVSLVLSIAALFMANDIFAFVKADAVKEITVSENTSVSSLAKELDDQGVINYHSVFKLYLTLKHQTDTSVLAGAYQLNPSMDYGQIVDALANTASTETVQITIPEGYSISQIRQVLLDNHICTEDALDEVLNDYSFKHDFLKDEKPAAEGWLEGYLFPDTYEVYK